MGNLDKIKPIFSAALDKQGIDRQAYLDEICAEDADLGRNAWTIL